MGDRVRLIDTGKGIWNPRHLNATLSIVSSPDGPYDDGEIEGGLFRYDYRAGSVEGDNAKLRRAGELRLPLILLRKVEAGVYIPVFPVYVVHDDVSRRQFVVALDESLQMLPDPTHLSEVERRYAERITRHRLHQSMFRGMVVRAYEVRCAVCRLRSRRAPGCRPHHRGQRGDRARDRQQWPEPVQDPPCGVRREPARHLP